MRTFNSAWLVARLRKLNTNIVPCVSKSTKTLSVHTSVNVWSLFKPQDGSCKQQLVPWSALYNFAIELSSTVKSTPCHATVRTCPAFLCLVCLDTKGRLLECMSSRGVVRTNRGHRLFIRGVSLPGCFRLTWSWCIVHRAGTTGRRLKDLQTEPQRLYAKMAGLLVEVIASIKVCQWHMFCLTGNVRRRRRLRTNYFFAETTIGRSALAESTDESASKYETKCYNKNFACQKIGHEFNCPSCTLYAGRRFSATADTKKSARRSFRLNESSSSSTSAIQQALPNRRKHFE